MIAEYTSLKIVRILKYAWLYYPNASEKCFAISKGYMTYDENDNKILIVEDGRSHRPKVLLNNVTLHDLYMGESEISFTNVQQLFNTLTLKGNPLFVNVIQTGSGGSSQTLQQTLENGATYTSSGKTIAIIESGIQIYDEITENILNIGLAAYLTGQKPTIGLTPSVGDATYIEFPLTGAVEEVSYKSYVYTAKTEAEAYADGLFDTLVGASPTDLDTIQEISAALQNNPDVIAELMTALGNRLRFDINNQGLSSTEKANALANLGIVISDLLNRANHLGSQAISTITGLQTELDAKDIKRTELNLLNDYTLSSITTAQKLFNVGTSGNGAFSLDANSLYEFEMFVYLDNLSTTSSNFSFQILGTATYSNILLKTEAIKQAFITGNIFNGIITSTSSYMLVTNSTVSTGFIKITGSFRTSSAGTFIPSILLSVANAANVKKGSNAKIKKIGADTFTATSGIS